MNYVSCCPRRCLPVCVAFEVAILTNLSQAKAAMKAVKIINQGSRMDSEFAKDDETAIPLGSPADFAQRKIPSRMM